MKKNSIYILLTCFLFAACHNEENTDQFGNIPVEVTAKINDLTRTSLANNLFDSGDSFILYEGKPMLNNDSKSEYKYDGYNWSGNPGLFWDNLKVWNSGSLIDDSTLFTGVLTNSGTLTLSASGASFTVAEDQNVTEKEYLKNDVLVAYDLESVSDPKDSRKLSLKFSHIFARLKIVIEEADPGVTPEIMSDETTVTLSGIKTGSTITFDADANETDPEKKTTKVEATDGFNGDAVILRNSGSDSEERTFNYEAIIPAQSLATGIMLTISNNENGKVYTYNLSAANIIINGATDKEDLLQQGHITNLSLKIQKSEITSVTATLTDWIKTSSSTEGTPTDYPTIEIGKGDGGEGGEDGGGLDKDDDYAGKTIQLTSDIEAKDLSGLPFGSRTTPFRGTFDGQGHTIRNVVLSNAEGEELYGLDFLGVFGYTDGATIKNLNIEVVEITNVSKNSSTATGGLAGYINNTLIENCHVILSKDGEANTITASYNNAGGLVGYVNGASTIRYCSANATVTTNQDYAGGLIGQSQSNMALTQCFTKGIVTADGYYAGGLIGYSLEGETTFSYSWASVSATRYSGGLIGRANSTTISNCYAAGAIVSGDANAAGLIGLSNIAVKNCYWNLSCNANTKVVIGITLDNSCSSFTPTETEAAMGTVLNGLNLKDNVLTNNWKLNVTDYNNYVLPTLFSNEGKAKPTE